MPEPECPYCGGEHGKRGALCGYVDEDEFGDPCSACGDWRPCDCDKQADEELEDDDDGED